MALYADYIMLYCLIYIYTPADYSLVQQDIDDICPWMTNNVLKFKCKYTVISRNKSHSQPITQLTVDNLPMEQLQSYMQVPIGVGLPTLTWSVPVENVCQRARRQIGVEVLCLFKQLNTITTLYLV